MRRVCSLAFLVGSFLRPSLFGAAPAPKNVHVSPSGKTTIVAGEGKSKIEVTIITHQEEKPERDKRGTKPSSSPCTGMVFPCRIVDSLEIAIGGHPISVPLSAFCDLADLDTARVSFGKKWRTLELTEGDASESYIVRIDFDHEGVNRKTISLGYAPDQLLEKTYYYSVVIGH